MTSKQYIQAGETGHTRHEHDLCSDNSVGYSSANEELLALHPHSVLMPKSGATRRGSVGSSDGGECKKTISDSTPQTLDQTPHNTPSLKKTVPMEIQNIYSCPISTSNVPRTPLAVHPSLSLSSGEKHTGKLPIELQSSRTKSSQSRRESEVSTSYLLDLAVCKELMVLQELEDSDFTSTGQPPVGSTFNCDVSEFSICHDGDLIVKKMFRELKQLLAKKQVDFDVVQRHVSDLYSFILMGLTCETIRNVIFTPNFISSLKSALSDIGDRSLSPLKVGSYKKSRLDPDQLNALHTLHLSLKEPISRVVSLASLIEIAIGILSMKCLSKASSTAPSSASVNTSYFNYDGASLCQNGEGLAVSTSRIVQSFSSRALISSKPVLIFVLPCPKSDSLRFRKRLDFLSRLNDSATSPAVSESVLWCFTSRFLDSLAWVRSTALFGSSFFSVPESFSPPAFVSPGVNLVPVSATFAHAAKKIRIFWETSWCIKNGQNCIGNDSNGDSQNLFRSWRDPSFDFIHRNLSRNSAVMNVQLQKFFLSTSRQFDIHPEWISFLFRTVSFHIQIVLSIVARKDYLIESICVLSPLITLVVDRIKNGALPVLGLAARPQSACSTSAPEVRNVAKLSKSQVPLPCSQSIDASEFNEELPEDKSLLQNLEWELDSVQSYPLSAQPSLVSQASVNRAQLNNSAVKTALFDKGEIVSELALQPIVNLSKKISPGLHKPDPAHSISCEVSNTPLGLFLTDVSHFAAVQSVLSALPVASPVTLWCLLCILHAQPNAAELVKEFLEVQPSVKADTNDLISTSDKIVDWLIGCAMEGGRVLEDILGTNVLMWDSTRHNHNPGQPTGSSCQKSAITNKPHSMVNGMTMGYSKANNNNNSKSRDDLAEFSHVSALLDTTVLADNSNSVRNQPVPLLSSSNPASRAAAFVRMANSVWRSLALRFYDLDIRDSLQKESQSTSEMITSTVQQRLSNSESVWASCFVRVIGDLTLNSTFDSGIPVGLFAPKYPSVDECKRQDISSSNILSVSELYGMDSLALCQSKAAKTEGSLLVTNSEVSAIKDNAKTLASKVDTCKATLEILAGREASLTKELANLTEGPVARHSSQLIQLLDRCESAAADARLLTGTVNSQHLSVTTQISDIKKCFAAADILCKQMASACGDMEKLKTDFLKTASQVSALNDTLEKTVSSVSSLDEAVAQDNHRLQELALKVGIESNLQTDKFESCRADLQRLEDVVGGCLDALATVNSKVEGFGVELSTTKTDLTSTHGDIESLAKSCARQKTNIDSFASRFISIEKELQDNRESTSETIAGQFHRRDLDSEEKYNTLSSYISDFSSEVKDSVVATRDGLERKVEEIRKYLDDELKKAYPCNELKSVRFEIDRINKKDDENHNALEKVYQRTDDIHSYTLKLAAETRKSHDNLRKELDEVIESVSSLHLCVGSLEKFEKRTEQEEKRTDRKYEELRQLFELRTKTIDELQAKVQEQQITIQQLISSGKPKSRLSFFSRYREAGYPIVNPNSAIESASIRSEALRSDRQSRQISQSGSAADECMDTISEGTLGRKFIVNCDQGVEMSFTNCVDSKENTKKLNSRTDQQKEETRRHLRFRSRYKHQQADFENEDQNRSGMQSLTAENPSPHHNSSPICDENLTNEVNGDRLAQSRTPRKYRLQLDQKINNVDKSESTDSPVSGRKYLFGACIGGNL